MAFGQVNALHRRRVMADVVEKRADSSGMYVHYKKRHLTSAKLAIACSNLYTSPTIGETINALEPLTITWNTSCLSVQSIDIYLYAPGAVNPRIHLWQSVAFSGGTYNATLMPRWWNSTASQTLQVSIMPAGQPPFLSAFPAGPVFTATYVAPASGTPASANTAIVGSGITQVDDIAKAEKALGGKKAAAAIMTLLVVAALCIAGYIRYKRMKGKKERKRWTEAVDKRMSTISADWKSVSAAGANAAIRNSIAVGRRSSSFSFGGIRPSSTFAVEGEVESEKRPMSQMRTGAGLRNPTTPLSTERVSRVSFAPDTRISRGSESGVSFAPDSRTSRISESRPSGESRRTRAFHTGYVPPVPGLPAADGSDSGLISPRQSQGPLTLTPDAIRVRMVHHNASSSSGNEMDEVLPALRSKSSIKISLSFNSPLMLVMRSGSDPLSPDDLLLKIPDPPEAAHPKPPQHTASPVMSMMPMEPMPANVMSPDEMLRAYAERKKSMSAPSRPPTSSLTSITSINYPKAIAKRFSMKSKQKRISNTMRVLYKGATGSLNSSTDMSHDSSSDTGHQSIPPSDTSISEENHVIEDIADNVVGEHPFGYRVGTYGGAHYAVGEEVGVTGEGIGAVYNIGQAA